AESVAWITERKNVLSTFFYLLAFNAYLRFDRLDDRTPTPVSRGWGWYALAFVLFVLALCSKTVTCSLPAAILLVTWWRRERIRVADVLPLVPMFAAGAALSSVTSWLERTHVRTIDYDFGLRTLDRVVLCGQALWFYLGKLVWPANLIFMYPRWRVSS